MRVPQVNERVKEAPAQALRAMFAGIGQLLSATDKLRGKSAQAPATTETAAKAPETTAANGAATAPETVVTTETVTVETPAPETTVEAAAPAAPEKAPKPGSAPAGGNAKPTPSEKAAPQAAGTSSAPTRAKVDELAVEEAPPVAAAEPAAAEVTPAAELPLANYDSLTVASLRARLRNLSVAQLGQLIAYEKAHADRADVIAMFERRVAKLESES
jgi:hypothetical protein